MYIPLGFLWAYEKMNYISKQLWTQSQLSVSPVSPHPACPALPCPAPHGALQVLGQGLSGTRQGKGLLRTQKNRKGYCESSFYLCKHERACESAPVPVPRWSCTYLDKQDLEVTIVTCHQPCGTDVYCKTRLQIYIYKYVCVCVCLYIALIFDIVEILTGCQGYSNNSDAFW